MQGAVTVHEVPSLWQQRASLFTEQVCDLSAVTDIDSAGIAFLVQWAKALRRQGQTLTLLHVPAQALRLISTFKLQPLFVLS